MNDKMAIASNRRASDRRWARLLFLCPMVLIALIMYACWSYHQRLLVLQSEGKTATAQEKILVGTRRTPPRIVVRPFRRLKAAYDYTYVVGGQEYEGCQDDADPVGQPVTYLPSDPRTHEVGLIDSARVEKDFWKSLAVEGFLALCFLGFLLAFCFPQLFESDSAHAPSQAGLRRYVLLGKDGTGGVMYWD
jgi:hypothetical protein